MADDNGNWSLINGTGSASGRTTVMTWSLSVVLSFACLVVLSNASILLTMLSNKYLRNSSFSHILGLRFSDALVGVAMMHMSAQALSGYEASVAWCSASISIIAIAQGASTTHLLLVCLRRCWILRNKCTHPHAVSISHPKQSTSPSLGVIFASIYIVNVILLSIPFIVWTRRSDESVECQPNLVFGENVQIIMQYTNTVFVIPHIVMNLMYAWLIRQLFLYRRHIMRARSNDIEMDVLRAPAPNASSSQPTRSRLVSGPQPTRSRLVSGPQPTRTRLVSGPQPTRARLVSGRRRSRVNSIERLNADVLCSTHRRAVITIGVIVAFHDIMATPCMVTGLVSFDDENLGGCIFEYCGC
jgi:hypothetical protein